MYNLLEVKDVPLGIYCVFNNKLWLIELQFLCMSSELGSWTWGNVMGSSKDGWEWIIDTERECQEG